LLHRLVRGTIRSGRSGLIRIRAGGGVVDQDFLQERAVVVDVAVEQLDLLGVVHHTRLAPLHVRPVSAPDDAIGRRSMKARATGMASSQPLSMGESRLPLEIITHQLPLAS